ncbi:MAG: glycosyltransferase [Bacteroidales bacterium]|nr:glycosyltransferase [Bacteroidales bacterium]
MDHLDIKNKKKIVLVARGSNGDIFPYLSIAAELQRRGHCITISIPSLFEEDAKKYGLNYLIQSKDDLGNFMSQTVRVKTLLTWINDVIDDQYFELMPLVQDCDLLIATNTELAAPNIAEYCKKPLIRTAYGPFLPGKKIPPPIFPFPKPNRIITPLLWKLINTSINMIAVKTLNKYRSLYGMRPMKSYAQHAPAHSHNQLLYSPTLGSVDVDWNYSWGISGYCFNDTFHYEEAAYEKLIKFIKKDERPTLFFTFGSCSSKKGKRFVEMLQSVVKKNDYKLVIGSGWSKTGVHLEQDEHLYILRDTIPHSLIFPQCDAIIHHGGCGTTHSVARAGKPQMIIPLFLDQHYWRYRIHTLGLGPKRTGIGNISFKKLEKRINNLLFNPDYKKNAIEIAEKINRENGIGTFCDYVETF